MDSNVSCRFVTLPGTLVFSKIYFFPTKPFTHSSLNFPLSQAVELDETDVSLWLQMGRIALQVDNFVLASQAFQEVCLEQDVCSGNILNSTVNRLSLCL